MTNINAYEALYNNMKNKFTVVSDNREFSLGEYMSMKANGNKASNLPCARNNNEIRSISAIFSYVNDKLTVKKAPVKDKTMRAFPFRTSAASFLSAIVACALMFSYGIFAVRNTSTSPSTVESGEDTYEVSEAYDTEVIEKK